MSWYNETGPENDVAVSTRVRLARNIKGIPFPSKINEKQKEEINSKVKKALESSELPIAKRLKFIQMDSVPENERFSMVERHIISREFANNCSGKAILLSEDESVCVMLLEEDHIRIQVILAGLDVSKCYEIAESVDDMLSSGLQIAYSQKLGYLTECPTNLGTGLRASVMLHLPLLMASGEFKMLTESVNKLGFTVRGLYGEGSEPTASLFQISNQITLGITEKEAIDNLKAITDQLISKERQYRENADRLRLDDICLRAFGTLKYARVLSSREMTELIGKVKLAQSVGAIKDKALMPFKLFVEAQPFMIMRSEGNITPAERDIKRAEIIREALKNIN